MPSSEVANKFKVLSQSTKSPGLVANSVSGLFQFFNHVREQEYVTLDDVTNVFKTISKNGEIRIVLGELVTALQDAGVEVIEPPAAREEPQPEVNTNDNDQEFLLDETLATEQDFNEPRQSSRHTAPVRSYSRTVAKARVLTREREAELARQLEVGISLQLEALAIFPGVIDYILEVYEQLRDANRVEDLLLGFVNPPITLQHNEHDNSGIQTENQYIENEKELDPIEVERRIVRLKEAHVRCQTALVEAQDWQAPEVAHSLANVANLFKYFKLAPKHFDRVRLIVKTSLQILQDERQRLEHLVRKSGIPIETFHQAFKTDERVDHWLERLLMNQPYGDMLRGVETEIQSALQRIDEELLDQRHSRRELDLYQDLCNFLTPVHANRPRISDDFVYAIYRKLQQGAELRSSAWDELIIANQRLVIWIARKYWHPSYNFLDLVGDGNLGLMKAIDKFDYRRGFKLSTYATWWIRQSISRSLANYSRVIRLPVYMHDAVVKLRTTAQKMTEELGREPTAEELSYRTGEDETKVRHMQDADRDVLSIDDPVEEAFDVEAMVMEFGLDQTLILDSPDEDVDPTLGIEDIKASTIGDVVEDSRYESPIEQAAKSSLIHAVRAALDELDPRENLILSMRFGIRSDRGHTLQEIGELLGVTRERVRQIEAVALSRIYMSNHIRALIG